MTLPANMPIFINVGVVLLLVISFIIGYKKGVLIEIFKTVTILIVILLSWILSPGLAELINIFPAKYAPFRDSVLAPIFYDKINSLCWFLIVFIIGLIIIAIIRPVFKVIGEIPILKQANQLVGGLVSIIPTFIIILLFTYLLNTPLFQNGEEVVQKTVLKYSTVVADKTMSIISDSFKENQAIQKMISKPLSLDDQDIKEIIGWLDRSKVSSEDIYNFLKNYGIDTEKLNEVIQNLEENNE